MDLVTPPRKFASMSSCHNSCQSCIQRKILSLGGVLICVDRGPSFVTWMLWASLAAEIPVQSLGWWKKYMNALWKKKYGILEIGYACIYTTYKCDKTLSFFRLWHISKRIELLHSDACIQTVSLYSLFFWRRFFIFKPSVAMPLTMRPILIYSYITNKRFPKGYDWTF